MPSIFIPGIAEADDAGAGGGEYISIVGAGVGDWGADVGEGVANCEGFAVGEGVAAGIGIVMPGIGTMVAAERGAGVPIPAIWAVAVFGIQAASKTVRSADSRATDANIPGSSIVDILHVVVDQRLPQQW